LKTAPIATYAATTISVLTPITTA